MERESQGFTVATLTTLVLLSLVGTLTLGAVSYTHLTLPTSDLV